MTTATAENGPSSGEPPAGPAEDRVFDLTARVGWTNRFVLGLLGLVMIANGLMNLVRLEQLRVGGDPGARGRADQHLLRPRRAARQLPVQADEPACHRLLAGGSQHQAGGVRAAAHALG